jgi:tetratricopeptide (TPR) repeat protein/SAM-dependent methyltransferase
VNSSADEVFRQALGAMQTGRVIAAESLFKQVLQVQPQHVPALNLISVLLSNLRRFDEADRYVRMALSQDQSSATTFHNHGLILTALNRLDQAFEQFGRALQINATVAETWSCRGATLIGLQRYRDAIADLDRALAISRDYPDALVNKGEALAKLDRYGDALAVYDQALELKPDLPKAGLGRGNVLVKLKRYEQASAAFDRILSLQPEMAEAWLGRGNAYSGLDRFDEALAAYDRALNLKPDLVEAWLGRGNVHITAEKPELAVYPFSRALEVNETLQTKTAFAQCIKSITFKADDERLRQLVLRAFNEGWARPRDLTNVVISLIKLDPLVSAAVARANLAWPARLPVGELLGSSSGLTALSQNLLLRSLLESQLVVDLGLERLLTNLRYALQTSATEEVWDEDRLELGCALARQSFVNEYVFAITETESERACLLRRLLEDALLKGAPFPRHWLCVVGAYFPLHSLPKVECLIDSRWPECVEALLAQQIEEPMEERRIRTTIPAVTTIDDEVSRLVRAQYEENPYPRWTKTGPPMQPAILASESETVGDVLIAGCGTGFFAVDFAREASGARFLAIDLSLSSLSYAKRMAQSMGLTNIEFAQADIMQSASIGRQFDFIDSSGVLHHLGDPWAGWRMLLTLLRPGGLMQVGLYSELARKNVVAARALIAKRGFRPVPEDIRRMREIIAAADDGSPLNSITRWGDYYSTSECRDLLFHPQEHRATLPEIKSFITANGLEFVGFNLDTGTGRRFAMRFPEPAALIDFDCWHAFETDAPDTFIGMYQFWVRKPQ